MSSNDNLPEKFTDPEIASHIYILPNMMTAGNLFCGFLASIRCIQAKYAEMMQDTTAEAALTGAVAQSPQQLYAQAVYLILVAVIFDALDGRLARLGGRESLFGKEFDSIADVISFGIAPALMVFFLILSPTDEYPEFRGIGWLIGFIYLLCGAVRLARFNVITHPIIDPEKRPDNKAFRGLPIPAAAGLTASLVLLLTEYNIREGAIFLPALLLLVAWLMVSDIPYPSFKKLGWQTRFKSPLMLIGLIILGAVIFKFHVIAIPLLFIVYIFYGLGRHLYSLKRRPPKSGGGSGGKGTQAAPAGDPTVPAGDTPKS